MPLVTASNGDLGAIVLCILVALYLLPAYVAYRRQHHQCLAMTMLTLLAGWTVVGWIVAMVWACTVVRDEGRR
jgi:hypothetical protein